MATAKPTVLAALLCVLLAAPSNAAQLYGPYRAEIVRVVDGDTLEMDIDVWPSLRARSMVRMRGLDTPELQGPACERSLAQRARDYLSKLAIGTAQVDRVEPEKFGGRISARVKARGVDSSRGHACRRPWAGLRWGKA